ncbi:MAG TPA: tripartite tricarboxylate transporter substrate binding protein, partial [Burkholderiales bacterium]|nr:tripartite tricarboxylate transporter substrate binding protein [Burkholderiales bacterium]
LAFSNRERRNASIRERLHVGADARRVIDAKIDDSRLSEMQLVCILALVAAAVTGSTVGLVHAQAYPAKPVRLIVPVAPGGATDIIARAVGQRLTAGWNQAVLVDNRPGAGSNIGFEVASKAPADGYTVLLAQPAFTVNVSLYSKLAYDPLRDFAPVTLAVTGANVLVVHPAVPARTLKELIALARARPGQLSYASSGNGTTPHLSGELFKSMAGIDIVHVPYRGASQSVIDLIGGHVDMAFVSLSSVLPQLTAKKLRGLATTSAQRTALMPDLPTFAEGGLKGYEVYGWYGFLVPAGTPKDVIARLNADIGKALTAPDVLQTLTGVGLEAVKANSPEEFGAFLRAEISKWAKVVQRSGAKPD